jgi:hypothetical protein
MEYPIYKFNKKRNLILWDETGTSKKEAVKLLKTRRKEYPKEKFVIVKIKEY